MNVFLDPITFDWDKGNSDKNWIKHNVTNQEAEEAFRNEPTFIFKDERHSVTEDRYGLFGRTNKGRLLAIVFTLRNEKVRVITARDMIRRERRAYEKIETNPNI